MTTKKDNHDKTPLLRDGNEGSNPSEQSEMVARSLAVLRKGFENAILKEEALKEFIKWCKRKYPHFIPEKWTEEDNAIIDIIISLTKQEVLKVIEEIGRDMGIHIQTGRGEYKYTTFNKSEIYEKLLSELGLNKKKINGGDE